MESYPMHRYDFSRNLPREKNNFIYNVNKSDNLADAINFNTWVRAHLILINS